MSNDVRVRNNVNERGQGTQPLLFAHGFGCDQHMWRFVAPAFEDDYRVVLFDFVGSGRSDLRHYDTKRYSSLDGYAQDVLEIVEALDLRDVIFVGHSVSAMIGALAVKAAPERFAEMIMVCPSPRYVDEQPDYIGGFTRDDIAGLLDLMERNHIGWAEFLAPVVMGNPGRPELTDELEESFCSTDPKIARRFAEATFYADNREDLDDVRVPTLVLQCREDAIAPPQVGEYVHARLPHSTYHLLAATGHCPHLSHPRPTMAAMREYLSGQ